MEMGRAGFYPPVWVYLTKPGITSIRANVSGSVLVQFDLPVPEHPKITLTIRDQRGYNLYGINNLLLGKALNVEPDGRLRTRISFDCDLQAGEYALTFRLENSLSESVCELMDKKVNAAIFRVFNSPKCFDAVVNLHGAFEPVPFCCETRATQ